MSDFFLLDYMQQAGDKDAIIWKDSVISYKTLLERVSFYRDFISNNSIPSGAVVSIEADFAPDSVALFLALIEHGAVLVPLTNSVRAKLPEFLEAASVEFRLKLEGQAFIVEKTSYSADHALYKELKGRSHPGLILFSSGSTGKSKAALHDLIPLLQKFKVKRHQQRILAFLLFDHIGGFNTLFYTLSNGGSLITLEDRSPETVLSAIDKWQVDLLPTSPTFLNLLLMSEAYKHHSLKSLKTITYGTEPMLESTLKRLTELYPQINFLQTYGLSEVGILRSKSKSSDSLWVQIGGEGFQTRVVDGLLEIKAESAMLGYLNAPSPFTSDGWFMTGDTVLQDGDFFRILGRKSEIINVGGEKVYPAEIESVLHEIPNVAQATVFGEKNPITGQIVCAKVCPSKPDTDERTLVSEIRKYCSSRLERYKIPVKIQIQQEDHHTERFKRDRARISNSH